MFASIKSQFSLSKLNDFLDYLPSEEKYEISVQFRVVYYGKKLSDFIGEKGSAILGEEVSNQVLKQTHELEVGYIKIREIESLKQLLKNPILDGSFLTINEIYIEVEGKYNIKTDLFSVKIELYKKKPFMQLCKLFKSIPMTITYNNEKK